MIGILCSGAMQHPGLMAIRMPVFLWSSSAALAALPAWFWNPMLSYVSAVLLLIAGVSIAIQKSSPKANWLEKITLCGPVFIGIPMVVFGLDHYLFPAGIGQIIPAWIPAHTFWVYFVGTCLILGGLSIVFKKYAWLAAGLFGVMLLCFEALMNIPAVVSLPHNRMMWLLMVREFSFGWGALSFAAMHSEAWRTKGTHWLISIARVVLGIALVVFAVDFFRHPQLLPGVPLEQLTPGFFPVHLVWGYVTGVVYIVAGVCLLINKKEKLAATWVGVFVLFSVIVFCVPYMFQYLSDIGKGLNVPADTLLFSGALLGLAGSLREKPASPGGERMSS